MFTSVAHSNGLERVLSYALLQYYRDGPHDKRSQHVFVASEIK
jgi:hypothetical protein